MRARSAHKHARTGVRARSAHRYARARSAHKHAGTGVCVCVFVRMHTRPYVRVCAGEDPDFFPRGESDFLRESLFAHLKAMQISFLIFLGF